MYENQLIPHSEYLLLGRLIATHRREGSLSEPDLDILRGILGALVSPGNIDQAMAAAIRRMGPPRPSALIGLALGIEQGHTHRA
jgi:hypothetical protein